MSETEPRIVRVVSAPFEQNAYIAWIPGRTDALVIDPGFDTASLRNVLSREGLTPSTIIDTHGHADHIAGNGKLRQMYPDVAIWIGANESEFLVDPDLNLSAQFGIPLTSPPADRLLNEGEVVEVAGFRFEIREIPGHSPGSIALIAHDLEPPLAFVGDVIMAGSIGRFDFPGGDGPRLLKGIREKLLDLPDSTRLLSGHGPETTVGREKRSNPYVGERATEAVD